MGVAGAGKSTLGAALAARLGWRFMDADDHHPAQNVAKMAAGTPLDDADRRPWLEGLNAKLKSRQHAVLACSALKQSYREILAKDIPLCRFVFLKGSLELIRTRLKQRRHRYMPASLLESQFATLEPPANALAVDIALPPERCVEQIAAALR